MALIGLISDVHANTPALDLVYEQMRHQLGVRQFWCLGDTLGYGPDPEGAWAKMKIIAPKIWLVGNHDWYVAPADINAIDGPAILPGPIFRDKEQKEQVGGPRKSAWDVALRHRDVLDLSVLEALQDMKERAHPLPNVFVCHAIYTRHNGNIPNTWLEKNTSQVAEFAPFYELPDAPWFELLDSPLPVLHIGGHTHIQSLWSHPLGTEGDWTVHEKATRFPEPGKPYSLKAKHFYYINPGSVGFPRAPHPCPSAAVLDTENWQVTFYAFKGPSYNSEEIRAQMKNFGYPDDLWSEKQFKVCVSE